MDILKLDQPCTLHQEVWSYYSEQTLHDKWHAEDIHACIPQDANGSRVGPIHSIHGLLSD